MLVTVVLVYTHYRALFLFQVQVVGGRLARSVDGKTLHEVE